MSLTYVYISCCLKESVFRRKDVLLWLRDYVHISEDSLFIFSLVALTHALDWNLNDILGFVLRCKESAEARNSYYGQPQSFYFFHFIYSESNEKHLHHKPNFNMCLLGDKKIVSTGHCWREKGICVLLLVLASLVKTRSYWCCQMEVFVLACWMRGCCRAGHLVFLPLQIWYKAIEIE